MKRVKIHFNMIFESETEMWRSRKLSAT